MGKICVTIYILITKSRDLHAKSPVTTHASIVMPPTEARGVVAKAHGVGARVGASWASSRRHTAWATDGARRRVSRRARLTGVSRRGLVRRRARTTVVVDRDVAVVVVVG